MVRDLGANDEGLDWPRGKEQEAVGIAKHHAVDTSTGHLQLLSKLVSYTHLGRVQRLK